MRDSRDQLRAQLESQKKEVKDLRSHETTAQSERRSETERAAKRTSTGTAKGISARDLLDEYGDNAETAEEEPAASEREEPPEPAEPDAVTAPETRDTTQAAETVPDTSTDTTPAQPEEHDTETQANPQDTDSRAAETEDAPATTHHEDLPGEEEVEPFSMREETGPAVAVEPDTDQDEAEGVSAWDGYDPEEQDTEDATDIRARIARLEHQNKLMDASIEETEEVLRKLRHHAEELAEE